MSRYQLFSSQTQQATTNLQEQTMSPLSEMLTWNSGSPTSTLMSPTLLSISSPMIQPLSPVLSYNSYNPIACPDSPLWPPYGPVADAPTYSGEYVDPPMPSVVRATAYRQALAPLLPGVRIETPPMQGPLPSPRYIEISSISSHCYGC